MKLIGIDIGTTTISGVVLDAEAGTVDASRTVENGSFIETKHAWERIQDVSVIIAGAAKLLDELLAQHSNVSAIGLTGQMHGILYTDSEGRCLSPLYTWQDGRGGLPAADEEADEKTAAANGQTFAENVRCEKGQASAENVRCANGQTFAENVLCANGETLSEEVLRKTGTEVAAGYGLLTHLYNRRHGEVPEGAAGICTIADYFGMVLTKKKRPVMHVSNAASLGFFDTEKMCFDRKALAVFGIGEELIPEVTGNFLVLGQYQGLPVCTAVGDNQAGFLGSVGYQKNTLLVNVGTGGQISMMSDHCIRIPGIETRPFNKGTYLLVGASLCGGRAYAVLEKFFRMYAAALNGKETPQYDVMAKLAEKRKAGGLHVSTLFQGTRQKPEERGSITNICEENFTPENLIYGVLTGMAEELFAMYQKIYEETGIRAERLVASGNGLRKNPILQDIFSEMFKAELKMAAFEEEAASGAALSAAEAVSKEIF